jgi:hypothetical protein
LLCAAALAAAVCAPRVANAQFPLTNAPHFLWFDLDMTLGVGTLFEKKVERARYLSSLRFGVSVYAPYWIVTTGAVLRMMDFSKDRKKHNGGLQVEAINIPSGLWGYGGPHVSLDKKFGFVFGFGWSIFAVELDVFEHDSRLSARWFVKLRIPISVASFVLWQRRRLKKRK